MIAFKKDVLRRAAEISDYSESELNEALIKFSKMLNDTLKNEAYTRVTMPFGILYTTQDRFKDDVYVPKGFNSPSGDLLKLLNTIKDVRNYKDRSVYVRSHLRKESLMQQIGCTIEELEDYQNSNK